MGANANRDERGERIDLGEAECSPRTEIKFVEVLPDVILVHSRNRLAIQRGVHRRVVRVDDDVHAVYVGEGDDVVLRRVIGAL